MASTIHIIEALREIDYKINEDSTRKTFSIGFAIEDGSYVYLNRAISTGLRMNMKEKAMRGFLAVDENHKSIGHVYPVSVWAIIHFNGQKISL
jgi:hypothetical protein